MTLAATSRAARAELDKTGGLAQGRARVLDWLRSHPREDFTRAEIAKGANMFLQTVCGRVRDLLDEPEPLIKELSARCCRVNGRPSKTLQIKPAAPGTARNGESANPLAASVAPDECAALPPLSSTRPREAAVYDRNGKLLCYAIGYGPGWPIDQDHLHRGKR
jgi:hypothetical protein